MRIGKIGKSSAFCDHIRCVIIQDTSVFHTPQGESLKAGKVVPINHIVMNHDAIVRPLHKGFLVQHLHTVLIARFVWCKNESRLEATTECSIKLGR